MDPVEVETTTTEGGVFWLHHGLGTKPTSVVPNLRDEDVAVEVTGFGDLVIQGILRSRDTGDGIPGRTFTARFLAVTD